MRSKNASGRKQPCGHNTAPAVLWLLSYLAVYILSIFMKGTITLQDVIALIDSGQWMALEVVTADLKRGTGGEWIKLDRCRKNPKLTPTERTLARMKQPAVQPPKRDPRHYENSTRNMLLANGMIMKIHLRLIRKVNGLVVT